jgi:hypothetical protein
MWAERLDDLERHLDTMPDPEHEGEHNDRKRRRPR